MTGKRKIFPDPLLMMLTILAITGFQVYWIMNNYDREKRAMQIRANVAFQESVRGLQASKLKLAVPFEDSGMKRPKQIFINERFQPKGVSINMLPKQEIVTMVNAMREKFKDSGSRRKENSRVIVSSGKSLVLRHEPGVQTFEKTVNGDQIIRMLYGVDSLQDTLSIAEITSVYDSALKQEKLSVPFNISRSDSVIEFDEPGLADVTVGFAKPVTYHLELGNTFPYLLKKITLPILFSIFLVGVSILSFLLLYRSLLRQRRLAEIKNDFISNITHELKTPIATVGVAIEALKNFNAIHDQQRTKEYLDISSNELQRLSLLVDKVLKLSMFEKKEIELKFEQFHLDEIVDEVVASMRLQIEKFHAKVSVSKEGNTIVSGDRLHLLSVVFNLLDNALKYGKEEIDIKIHVAEIPGHVELTMSDNGIGIPGEYRDKIFEKFFRVPTGNTHNAKGYGLGLSYASHVVEKHQGKIFVESDPGKGTSFIIRLPKNQDGEKTRV